MARVTFTLNGSPATADSRPNSTLLEVLRGGFRLKGAKEGCGVGVCGTCTVLLDNRPVSSCLVLAVNVAGRDVLTIEGLLGNRGIHPLQEAFLESTAFQCGFCTPGMILATKALLHALPEATDDEAKDYLAGNLCRCGTYMEVLDAVRTARRKLREAGA